MGSTDDAMTKEDIAIMQERRQEALSLFHNGGPSAPMMLYNYALDVGRCLEEIERLQTELAGTK